mmetsp:Transcript_14171/g.35842  ORF Transcript_14171/g.35842 Transcript_14171/m.35842 type:complete len:255 (+) Transcript_14171:238-1002(+)
MPRKRKEPEPSVDDIENGEDEAGPSEPGQPDSEAGNTQQIILHSGFVPGQKTDGIVPSIQNVVATVQMGCRLDLRAIVRQARNAEYNPRRFAAVIMRIREPKTTALMFQSGKMVCTGAKSENLSQLAARKYVRVVQKCGFPAQFQNFKVQNMVGSCDVQFPVRLEVLALTHSMFCSYEPEIFPGLIYKMKQPKVVLLVFVSGKIVLTGAKSREDIYQAFENIYPVLKEFRKNIHTPAPAATPAIEAAKTKDVNK